MARPTRMSRAASALATILIVLATPLQASPTLDESVPASVRSEIEIVLRARTSEIQQEKNERGESFKRTTLSENFRKVDENKYRVGLHVNTALDRTMVVERYEVTIARSGAGWSIVQEELQDTYKGLHRGILGDESCKRFDRFSFDREGLRVSATNGTVCEDYFMDEVSHLAFTGADLQYEYVPPVPKDFSVHRLLEKERGADLVFRPDLVSISCDPETCRDFLETSFTGIQDVSRDSIDAVLAAAYDKWDKETIEDLAENPFRGFRRPLEPDRKRYWIGVRKKGIEDHWLSLVHDDYDGKEISVYLSGVFGALYNYFSQETRDSGVNPYDLELRPDADARDYEVFGLEGTAELGFGDGETLIGDITYGLTTLRPLRELPFSIARIFQTEEKKETKNPTMIINSVQDGNGNEMTWVRTGLYSGLVVLPEEVPAGTKMTMRLRFVNKDSIYKLTPTFSYVDRGGWLPFVRFADMIDTFDLTVKVPARYTTLGIGKKISESTKGDVNTTRWTSSSPVSFPTVIFGKYHVAKSEFKATKLDGSEIPVNVYFDKDAMADYEIAPKALEKFANDAANSLNLYREVFKVDYPYDKLDLVNDPLGLFYGQAPSSLIYLGSGSFWSSGFTAGLLEGGSNISTFLDSLVAHEVAHQWWGSLISNSNFRNYWFVESLAEYSSALFTENVYGKDKYLRHVDAWRREILEADMRGSVQEGYTVWQGPGGFRPYRAALYAKGPYAFHIMRSTWGDEAFFKFLRDLVHDLKGKEIVTRDIQRVAEKSFGANLDWFFDQWLRGVGLPEFTFTYDVRPTENGEFLIEGQVEQKIYLKPGMDRKELLEGQYFTGLIPITITGKGGKEYRKRIAIEAPVTQFRFTLPEKPKEIVFNKYGEALAYDVVVKAEN